MITQIRQNKLFIILLGLISISLIGWFVWVSTTFRLTGTTPAIKGQIATATGTIKLDFSKKIKSTDYVRLVKGDNAATVLSVDVDNKSLILHLDTLEEDTKYTFSVGPISSESGEVIDSVLVDVTAVYIPNGDISKEQQALEISQTDRNNPTDPILDYIPYQGNDFFLEGEFTSDDEGNSILVLEAQLFLTRDDIARDREVVLEGYKKKVTDFIASKDLDPEAYLIRYVTNEPPVAN